jgi:hypothetical protein
MYDTFRCSDQEVKQAELRAAPIPGIVLEYGDLPIAFYDQTNVPIDIQTGKVLRNMMAGIPGKIPIRDVQPSDTVPTHSECFPWWNTMIQFRELKRHSVCFVE